MSQPEIKASSSTIEGYTSKDNNDNSAKEDLDSVMGLFENLKIEQKTMDVYKLELLKIKKDVLDTIAERDIEYSKYDELYEQTKIPTEKEIIEPLTEEENMLVDKVFRPRQSGILSQVKNATVEYKDIYKLLPETWLNDEIINFYFELLSDRASKDSSLPSIHCFNTFFCTTLREQGYAKVRRWTKRVDIFSKDILFVPINKSYHWVLGVIDMKNKRISIYDSLHGKDEFTLTLLLSYLEEEHLDKKKVLYDTSEWIIESPSNIPAQGNAYDCGVFTCTFAERISRQAPLDFSQKDMNTIRRKMVVNILNKKI
ncbi:hypothetical protein G6F37_004969 [Rhizopus arrhizus]|nr:hypothetical protein G6F38_005184 [Rhizopus arrhizus]KAG1159356.1 hypothetical protein G6F37_004969 [Rhizopus arrhizus]